MTHKLCCQQPVRRRLASVAAALCCFVNVAHARAVQAPAWLHALATLPLPPHDENTSAVLLQSETALIVQPDGRIKRTVRRAYKILRPEGRDRARLRVDFDGQSKVSGLHAWCISADHADVEVVP